MYPVLFKIGPFTIYSYGVCLALAFLICIFLIKKESKIYSLEAETIINFCFWLLISGIIGGRILYCLLNIHFYIKNPLEILMLHHGGLIWYGGLITATFIGILYLKKNHLPILKVADFISPYIALGHAVGRIGCFLNGCCFGKTSELWGIYFPVHQARLIPSQLYSSFFLVVIFLVLRWFRTRPHKQGEIFAFYILFYSTMRFFIEFIRGDSKPLILGLTIFQIISLFLIFISIYALHYIKSTKRR